MTLGVACLRVELPRNETPFPISRAVEFIQHERRGARHLDFLVDACGNVVAETPRGVFLSLIVVEML